MRAGARAAAPLLAVLGLLLFVVPSAWAHAQLVETTPASGATVPSEPALVVFDFNQAVGGTLGAVRVYDAQGNQVDNGTVVHPGGRQSRIGVGLRANLPDGTYTATYRVISADTHIVYGGMVFNIGHAGAAPRFSVTGLIERDRTGSVTAVAFGAVRVADYIAIALAVGGLAFLLLVWARALPTVAGDEDRRQAASSALSERMRNLLLAAVLLGLASSILGVLLQGADAAGVSLWSSLKRPVIESTIESRFGAVWGSRALVWCALAGLLAVGGLIGGSPRHAQRWAAGTDAPTFEAPAVWLRALLMLSCAYLVLTPALSGHPSVQSPVWLFLPADALHVAGASIWLGGIACLLLALPAATRSLEPKERTGLLAANLDRFSPLALGAVVAIALTGLIQAYIDVRTLHNLLHSTYGQLLLVKTALLAALVGLGWMNRSRVIPALHRLVQAAAAPGSTGLLARRNLRSEALLILFVLGVTAALVSYTPPIDAGSGPFSTSARLGPAELELTVEPARAGLNTVHLYLIDAKSGTQFTQTRELTVSATLPSKSIGPLKLPATAAGPGHYVIAGATLAPAGEWKLRLTDRVSEFDSYSTVIGVPIR